jgi:cold shock CspA family protein
MRSNGTLTQWNDDRGFGFITPSEGSGTIFVHVSAFPRDGKRPQTGERLSYEAETGDNGKLRAVRVLRPGSPGLKRSPQRKDAGRQSSWLGSMVAAALVLGVAVYGYKHFQAHAHRMALVSGTLAPADIPAACDGRTMCSQMTSCAEAKWFINNCPGTQMDGNQDGTPCEQQWCSSPFSD